MGAVEADTRACRAAPAPELIDLGLPPAPVSVPTSLSVDLLSVVRVASS
jgi:hypothetical protein